MKSLFANLTNRLFARSRRNRWKSRRRFLHSAEIELLENRLLLTGNVKAALMGGDLVIEGDGGDNDVALAVIDGNLIVQGFRGTIINGAGSFTALVGSASIPQNLRIQLGSGNDTLLIGTGIQVGDDLSIHTGNGNNTVNLSGIDVADDLSLETGEGNDTVLLTDVSVADDLRLETGGGEDVVNISDSDFGDNLWMGTSSGNDIATVAGSSIGDNLLVAAGSGDDNYGVAESNSGTPFVTDPGTGQDEELFLRFQMDDLDGLTDARNSVSALVDPTATDDTYTVSGDVQTRSFDSLSGLISNDLPSAVGDSLSASLQTGPDNGTVTVNSDGSFEYSPDSDFDGVDTFTYTITNPMGGSDEGTVEITVQPFQLSLDLSANDNDTIQSNGTLLTNDETFVIEGETAPGATVQISRDSDGLFNDGTVVADAQGFFSINVVLIHHPSNRGANSIVVRSISATSGRQEEENVDVHYAIGTVVRFDSSQGSYDVELLDDDAPITVDNFIDYIETGRYVDSIVHRSPSDFVVQGGGFTYDAAAFPEIVPVPTFAPIQNEFDAGNSNLRGTLSMATIGGNINSGTSQWFINVVDNVALDDVPHTVFGRVIGTGMDVVDQINALDTFNLVDAFGSDLGALQEVPLDGFVPIDREITGTVSIAQGTNVVTGSGTLFTTEIRGAGTTIRIGGTEFTVASVDGDTQLTLDLPAGHPSGVSNIPAIINEPPLEDNFVVFSEISKILEP